jgi:hypothetical protein
VEGAFGNDMNGHWSSADRPNNLMVQGGRGSGTNLDPDQCTATRAKALARSARYERYNFDLGRTCWYRSSDAFGNLTLNVACGDPSEIAPMFQWVDIAWDRPGRGLVGSSTVSPRVCCLRGEEGQPNERFDICSLTGGEEVPGCAADCLSGSGCP